MPVERIFLGSSKKATNAATRLIRTLKTALPEERFEIVPWWTVFRPSSETPAQTLLDVALDFDYAVLLFTPDGITTASGRSFHQARDNVVFEYGFFYAWLGKDRVFRVAPDEESGAFELPTDIGRWVTAANYHFTGAPGAKTRITLPTLDKAAGDVASQILALSDNHKRERDTPDHAAAALKSAVDDYSSKIGSLKLKDAARTRILNVIGKCGKPFADLKSFATQRDIFDVATDLGDYYRWIEDLLDVEQLCQRQRMTSDRGKLKEVWVFADLPLEFDNSVTGQAGNHIQRLRRTIADNLNGGVKYCYFVPAGFEDRLIHAFLEELEVTEDGRARVNYVKLDQVGFMTNFTLHHYDRPQLEAYMSAVMPGRNDILIRVSKEQAKGVRTLLADLKGAEPAAPRYLAHGNA